MGRVVKWAVNQIVLVAKLRSNFQNQIAIAKNCDFPILDLKITQNLNFAMNEFDDNYFNGSQLKNPGISGAIFTLSLNILILNSQSVEGARDVRVFLIDSRYAINDYKK